MKKTALMVAEGCEEGEALTIADILRRAEITCDLVGLTSREVTGAHGITIRCDRVFEGDLDEYEMVILPGGYGGADALRDNSAFQRVLKKMDSEGKYIAAICAAPEALYKAGLLNGRRYTCYPTIRKRITGAVYTGEPTEQDGNIITGKGPAMAWAFAYKLADVLGADSTAVKNRMVYFNAFDVKEDH